MQRCIKKKLLYATKKLLYVYSVCRVFILWERQEFAWNFVETRNFLEIVILIILLL